MAFFLKKLFKRSSSKVHNNSDVLDSNSSESIVEHSELWPFSLTASSDSCTSDSTDLDQEIKSKSQVLNKSFMKCRKRNEELENKKLMLTIMQEEINEVTDMIQNTQIQMHALNEEYKSKRAEMAQLCNYISPGTQSDIKKREPILYKRFVDIKDDQDTKMLLSMVCQRKQILRDLEILVYRKHLELCHDIAAPVPSESKDRERVRKKDNGFQIVFKPPKEVQLNPFENEAPAGMTANSKKEELNTAQQNINNNIESLFGMLFSAAHIDTELISIATDNDRPLSETPV